MKTENENIEVETPGISEAEKQFLDLFADVIAADIISSVKSKRNED